MRRSVSQTACVICLVFFFVGAIQAGSPLDGLATLRDFRAMRSSSSDENWENGNGDARYIPPGETLTLCDLEGPGRVAHIWFTIADNEPSYGKLLVLRMYWDSESNPSVECPINDFFCQGHGLDVQVDCLPIRVTSNGRARNCYWPMPFGRSAKITVTNEGKEPCRALYYYIDWQKLDSLPEDTAYFHAQYRQEFPCISGRDYLILDAEGRGHFVGCNLSVRNREPGWWGEGDDRFYIDGEDVPSLLGTGSEDYFCDAWGMRKLDGLYYGFPIAEGFDTLQRSSCYRLHIQDPVPFTRSLKMVIEHKGARIMPDGNWNGYVERADDFSSVAYWYQLEPHKPFPPLPPAEERVYKTYVIEAESLLENAVASEGIAILQKLGGYSGGGQLFYMPKQAPASVEVKFSVAQAADYVLRVQYTRSFDYGIYQAYLDGAPVGKPIDLYAADVTRNPATSLGLRNLSAGEHTLKFETSAKNPSSKGYYFGIDLVEMVPMSP